MIRDAESLERRLGAARRLVRETLIPAEAEVAAADAVPESIVAQLRQQGFFGMSIPEDYGGLGLTMEEEVSLVLELGRAAPVFRSVFGTNNGIGSQGILLDGTEEQKRRFLPALAKGEIVSAFCMTEPAAGSDAAAIEATARREGAHYLLDGVKRYVTNGTVAGLFTVLARSDPESSGARGISAFLVAGDSPGLERGEPIGKMGQQGAPLCDIALRGVKVPAENLIGGVEGQGFKMAMKVLDRQRLHISALCVGLAARLLDDSLAHAMKRAQFGKPLAEHQLIQAMLADSKAESAAGRALVLDAARRRDAGEAVTTLASCAKLFCAEMLGRVADRAVQIHGSAGYTTETAIERLYRDARLFRIYEGSSQIQQIVIARNLVKDAKETSA